MSGLIDFNRVGAVPDCPLEEDTGVTSTDWSPGLMCGNTGLALGTADADAVEKDS